MHKVVLEEAWASDAALILQKPCVDFDLYRRRCEQFDPGRTYFQLPCKNIIRIVHRNRKAAREPSIETEKQQKV